VRIHFLGLWDTVSSVGWVCCQKSLPYTRNNPSVDRVRHAIAIDERRAYYAQNTWGSDFDDTITDVKEMWFAGGHCDVGGGFSEPESGLSSLALEWMIDEARKCKLLLEDCHLTKDGRVSWMSPGYFRIPQADKEGEERGKEQKELVEKTRRSRVSEGLVDYIKPDPHGHLHDALASWSWSSVRWWVCEWLPKCRKRADPTRCGLGKYFSIHAGQRRTMRDVTSEKSEVLERNWPTSLHMHLRYSLIHSVV